MKEKDQRQWGENEKRQNKIWGWGGWGMKNKIKGLGKEGMNFVVTGVGLSYGTSILSSAGASTTAIGNITSKLGTLGSMTGTKYQLGMLQEFSKIGSKKRRY